MDGTSETQGKENCYFSPQRICQTEDSLVPGYILTSLLACSISFVTRCPTTFIDIWVSREQFLLGFCKTIVIYFS
jgi:hypothetical protein